MVASIVTTVFSTQAISRPVSDFSSILNGPVADYYYLPVLIKKLTSNYHAHLQKTNKKLGEIISTIVFKFALKGSSFWAKKPYRQDENQKFNRAYSLSFLLQEYQR